MATPNEPWYRDWRWLGSTVVGPILVGSVILFLGSRFGERLDRIQDTLFINYSNAPQIWGYDPVEYTRNRIFNDFRFDDALSGDPDYLPYTDFAVQYLWADPYSRRVSHNLNARRGGDARISATVTEESVLRVRFVSTGWGTNITLRHRESRSASVRACEYLVIKLKSPESDSVGVRVRIVDHENVHWAYGSYRPANPGDNPELNAGPRLIEYERFDADGKLLMADSEEIRTLRVPLQKSNWAHFEFDGVRQINARIAESRLVMLNFVVFEVGFETNYSADPPLRHEMTGFYLHPEREGVLDIVEVALE